MKKYVLLCVVLLCFMAGCQTPQQENFYENLTAVVSSSVEAQQVATHQIVEAIGEVGVILPDKLAKIQVQLEKVDQYVDLAQAKAIEAAVAYDNEADQIGGWLKVGEIVAGVFCPEIALLLAAAGAGYGTIKSRKLTVTDKKYQAHRQAGERIMRSSEPVESNKVYAMIGEERQKLGL